MPEESQAVRSRLDQIIEGGAPALARRALILREEWATRTDDPAVAETTELLFEAYLNDPYLTRYPDPLS